MIYNEHALPILDEYRSATDANAIAIKELYAYMQQGGKDSQTLEELTKRMDDTRIMAADALDRLQQYRIDVSSY